MLLSTCQSTSNAIKYIALSPYELSELGHYDILCLFGFYGHYVGIGVPH